MPSLASDLAALRAGEISYPVFSRRTDRWVGGMARSFARGLAGVSAPIDVSDLEQLARLEVWNATSIYRYRCALCNRDAETASALARHSRERHGRAAEAKPPFVRYVYGRVGNVLFHEVRRHRRRQRWSGAMPAHDPISPADQHAIVLFAEYVEQARRDLGPAALRLMEELLGMRGLKSS